MRRCFACDKPLKPNPHVAVTLDGQIVYVGSECYKRIGKDGFQPPSGGPKIYRGRFSTAGILREIIKA